MNFCPECGADLRDNQTAKFCYSCGNQLTITGNLTTNYIENNNNVVNTDINQENNFDYFDFPEEKYFRDFMLEVMEHVESDSTLSNEVIAKKYFEAGKKFIEDIPNFNSPLDITAIWNDEIANHYDLDLKVQQEIYAKVEDFYLNDFTKTVNYFKASLFFQPNFPEAYYNLFVCYHLCKDFDEAQNCLVSYAETARDLFGSDSDYLKEAGFVCNQYSNCNQDRHNLNELPSWLLK
jgi:tetratricopeptide (TPR) repeat protein